MPETSHYQDGPTEFRSQHHREAYEKARAELESQADNPAVDAIHEESRQWAEGVGSAEDWAADVQAGNYKYKDAADREMVDNIHQLKEARRLVERSLAPGKVVPVEAEQRRGLGYEDDLQFAAPVESPVSRPGAKLPLSDRHTAPIPRIDSKYMHDQGNHPRHERLATLQDELDARMGPSLKKGGPEPLRSKSDLSRVGTATEALPALDATKELPAIQAETPEPGMMKRMGAYLRKRFSRHNK